MDALFSKSADPNTKLQNRDCYHLLMREFDGTSGRSYCVIESHMRCDGSTRKMVWEDLHSETFSSLERARTRYAERKLRLEQRGFIYSDMDLF